MTKFSIALSKSNSIIYILVFTAVAIVDLTIVSFSTYSGIEFPPSMNITLFVLFSTIFAISSLLLLGSVRQIISKSNGLPIRIKYYQAIIIATQALTVAILIVISVQMIAFNKYNILMVQASTYLTHLSALLFLLSLVSKFISGSIKKKLQILNYFIFWKIS